MNPHPTTARRVLVCLALAAAAVLATAGPANAAFIGGTDRPRISESGRDFGNNQFLGAPLNGGIINWHFEPATGVITPWISGQLYVNNLSGDCAQIVVKYHDSAHNELDIRSSPRYCPSDNRSHQYTISISSYGDPDVDHVIVQLTNGYSTVVGSAVEYVWS
jgi:hypothetical protein